MTEIPLSLYVHFPWCVKKCPYCDFNSHALRQPLPERDYIDALIDNLREQLEWSPGRPIQTIFMGGGTPSLVTPVEIGRLMDWVRNSGRLANGAEVTLEANPGATDESNYAAYLQAGINRLSIGVQSFNDALLGEIGRIHTAAHARQAIKVAKRAGFERINLDLMYGLPGQSTELARQDIQIALEQEVEHLSVYQLTIEANTEFAVRPPALPDTEQSWEMHEQSAQLLTGAAYEQYEVSAWSRGEPCWHNLNYWQFGDYLAIGAGAHGKLSRVEEGGLLTISRFWNFRHPKDYLAARRSGRYLANSKPVPEDQIIFEFLMNALRLHSGFGLSTFIRTTGKDSEQLLEVLETAFTRGWLILDGDVIRASEKGYRYLDSILLECM